MLDIYNLVVDLIGVVPIELEFIYGIATITLFLLICFVVISPFIIVYKLSRW